jgi:hypothetical protein
MVAVGVVGVVPVEGVVGVVAPAVPLAAAPDAGAPVTSVGGGTR